MIKKYLSFILTVIFILAVITSGCGSSGGGNGNGDNGGTGGNGGTGNNDTARFKAVNGWQGICTIKIKGPAERYNEDNQCNYESTIDRTATYSGTFTPFAFGQGADWKMTEGLVITAINDQTYEVGHGSSTLSTLVGGENVNVTEKIKGTLNEDSIVLYLGSDNYSLVFPETETTVTVTFYEAGSTTDVLQSGSNTWSIPGGRVNDIAYPATGLTLTGYRLIKDVLNFPPGGDGVRMDAELTWDLHPKIDLTPVENLNNVKKGL